MTGCPLMPWDHQAIAKMLRKEADSADGCAAAHADGISVDDKGTPKRDLYARKANAYKQAAEALESLSNNEPLTGQAAKDCSVEGVVE